MVARSLLAAPAHRLATEHLERALHAVAVAVISLRCAISEDSSKRSSAILLDSTSISSLCWLSPTCNATAASSFVSVW